jgi:hypothetical protein
MYTDAPANLQSNHTINLQQQHFTNPSLPFGPHHNDHNHNQDMDGDLLRSIVHLLQDPLGSTGRVHHDSGPLPGVVTGSCVLQYMHRWKRSRVSASNSLPYVYTCGINVGLAELGTTELGVIELIYQPSDKCCHGWRECDKVAWLSVRRFICYVFPGVLCLSWEDGHLFGI